MIKFNLLFKRKKLASSTPVAISASPVAISASPVVPVTRYRYVINFFRRDGTVIGGINCTSRTPIFKAYFWFLLRDSAKYNLNHSDGATIIIRSEVGKVEWRKEQVRENSSLRAPFK